MRGAGATVKRRALLPLLLLSAKAGAAGAFAAQKNAASKAKALDAASLRCARKTAVQAERS